MPRPVGQPIGQLIGRLATGKRANIIHLRERSGTSIDETMDETSTALERSGPDCTLQGAGGVRCPVSGGHNVESGESDIETNGTINKTCNLSVGRGGPRRTATAL